MCLFFRKCILWIIQYFFAKGNMESTADRLNESYLPSIFSYMSNSVRSCLNSSSVYVWTLVPSVFLAHEDRSSIAKEIPILSMNPNVRPAMLCYYKL